jgi:copper chaperone CopZ
MRTRTYTVAGMTCRHCATFVSEEVASLPGVTAVAVDVAAGSVTVTSEHELVTAEVRGAVEEAGYTLLSAAMPESAIG